MAAPRRSTGYYVLMGVVALCLSPLIILSLFVAFSPWGIAALTALAVVWAIIEIIRRFGFGRPAEPTRGGHP
jgi:hypothetical protein